MSTRQRPAAIPRFTAQRIGSLLVIGGIGVVKVPARRIEAGIAVDGRQMPGLGKHDGVDLHFKRCATRLRRGVEAPAFARALGNGRQMLALEIAG